MDNSRPKYKKNLIGFLGEYKIFFGGGNMEVVVTVVKSCKAPVKSSSPTNQHPVFYVPDALPVAQSKVSKH